jgi:hypothetical protein
LLLKNCHHFEGTGATMERRIATLAVRVISTNERLRSVSDDAGNAYTEANPMTWIAVEHRKPTKITCVYHDDTFEVKDANEQSITTTSIETTGATAIIGPDGIIRHLKD